MRAMVRGTPFTDATPVAIAIRRETSPARSSHCAARRLANAAVSILVLCLAWAAPSVLRAATTTRPAPHPTPTRLNSSSAADSVSTARRHSPNALGAATSPGGAGGAPHEIRWPEGTEVIPFENVEGILLVSASLRSSDGADTAGMLALDTGAGFLAIDRELAVHLGVSDSVGPPGHVDLAERPLTRLAIGGLEVDQVSPLLVSEGEVIRRV